MSTNTTTIPTTKGKSLWAYGTAGAVYGLGTGIINNLWILIFPYVTAYEIPKIPGLIDVISVSIFSFIGMLLAGFIYYSFTAKNMHTGTLMYRIFGVVALLISLAIPLQPSLVFPPEVLEIISANEMAFITFTVPMHFIVGIIAIYGLPKFVNSKVLG